MLRYLARTLPVVLKAHLLADGRRVSHLRRRVLPSQVDLNLHMNQAAYLQVIELGRADWLLRSGAWTRWRGQGVNPVVADQNITYRRELKPLARYTVQTRAVAVQGKLLRLESHLVVGQNVHARAEVHLIFVGPKGVLPNSQVESLCADLLVQPLRVERWTLPT